MHKTFSCLKILLIMVDVVLCNPNYFYNKTAGGWLKMHPVETTWQEASLKCFYEGTVLASPLNYELAEALHTVMVNSGVRSRIHLGTYSLFSDKNYVTIEGVPLDMIPIKWHVYQWIEDGNCLAMYLNDVGTSSYYIRPSLCSNRLPFICYKKREYGVNINECGNFDDRYHLNQQTGSCYKLHNIVTPWSKAYEICTDEGAHLAIINNELEAEVIKSMFPNRTNNAKSKEQMAIGLREWNADGTWLTIQGEGNVYNHWSTKKTNNDKNQACGFISREGTIDNNYCDYSAIFVCEKDPSITHFEIVSQANSNVEEGNSNVERSNLNIEEGNSNVEEGNPNVQEGNSNVEEGNSNAEEGNSNVQEGNPDVQEGNSNVQDGNPNVEEGNSNVEDGNSKVEEGNSNVEDGNSNVEEGNSNVAEGNPNIEEGNPNVEEGNSNVEEGNSHDDDYGEQKK